MVTLGWDHVITVHTVYRVWPAGQSSSLSQRVVGGGGGAWLCYGDSGVGSRDHCAHSVQSVASRPVLLTQSESGGWGGGGAWLCYGDSGVGSRDHCVH